MIDRDKLLRDRRERETTMDWEQLDDFEKAYVECALWSSSDGNGEPFDSNYDQFDLAPETIASMHSDCADFRQANAEDLKAQSDKQNGHDFWLTRNGHGAGFWDRGLGEIGQRLTDAAHVYSSSDLYIGDDGKVYAE
jgi:hypothetical protein